MEVNTITESKKPIWGLALSGGGYRATAFHLGTLKKLNEMGILSRIDKMSTISGGSITGAAYVLHKAKSDDYDSFHNKMVNSVKKDNVIKQALTSFTGVKMLLLIVLFFGFPLGLLVEWLIGGYQRQLFSYTPYWLLLVIGLVCLLAKYQFALLPISKEIERAYNYFFFDNKTLKDLSAKPLIGIGSTNLQTCRPFTFSQLKMADSSYSKFKLPVIFLHEKFPIAKAVMASSCVPFAFTPIAIDKAFYEDPRQYDKVAPKLVDGGVYDNQGIQKITQKGSMYESDIIITSDAGGGLLSSDKYLNSLSLVLRSMDLFMYRIKNFQMMENIYRNVKDAQKPIAYLSLGWTIDRCIPGFLENMIKGLVLPQIIAKHAFKQEWIDNPKLYKAEIIEHLEQTTDYKTIEANNLTKEQWEIAKNTPTNLTPLTEKQTDYLMRHAENMTELQVKLYLP